VASQWERLLVPPGTGRVSPAARRVSGRSMPAKNGWRLHPTETGPS